MSSVKIQRILDYKLICLLTLLIILNVIVMIPQPIFSQDKDVSFSMDFSRFRAQGKDVFVEIYYSLKRDGLTYQQSADGFQAGGLIRTFIKKDKKTMMVDSLVITDFTKSKNEILPTQKFTEQSNIQLGQGEYELISRFTDLVSKKSFTVSDSLKIRPFSNETLRLSDIQLANSIQKQAQKENKFDKNGLRIIPNASKTYGTGLEQLSFYTEAYNLKFEGEAKNSTYHSSYHIVDQQGKTIKEITGRSRNKPGSSCIINGSLDITDIPSGFYTFKIVLTDDFSGQFVETSKEFQVFRTGDFLAKKMKTEPTLVEFFEDEFENMQEAELKTYFDKIKYISLKEEQKIFKKLDLDGKREFLKNFWKQRDPQPATLINERKEEYSRLLEYANKNFSLGMKQGWKTDRGRVLLVYGQPSEIERFPSDSNSKAYQIWRYYEIEGGVEFVFVDIMRFRDFRLVHSTYSGEIQEYGWRDKYLPL